MKHLKNPKVFLLISVFIILIFLLSSCFVKPEYLDTQQPVIFIFSPTPNASYYSTSINVKFQVNEMYEKGKESGLDKAEVTLFQYSNPIFKTNIQANGYELVANFNIPLSNYYWSSYTLEIIASDKAGNTSQKKVNFYCNSYPNLSITLYLPSSITNTNLIYLSGEIFITKELYGDPQKVGVVISNSSGMTTNYISNFTETNWSATLTLNLEEAGTTPPSKYNQIFAILETTSNYNTNSYPMSLYYDTNKPYTAITNLTSNQVIPQNYTAITTNYDNYGLQEIKIIAIQGTTTNYFSQYYPLASSYININLSPGTNTLVPYAKDQAGNEFYGSNINVVVDTGMPSISIYSPTSDFQEYLTSSNTITFSGNASVGSGYEITSIVLLIYTNTTLASSSSLSTNISTVNWSFTESVFQGTNKVYYYSQSDSGKTSPTNYITLIVDYIKPIAKIISPTNSEEITNGYIPVVTYIDDTNFSTGVQGYIIVNGSYSYITNKGTNTNHISLQEGSNVIEIFAIDNFSNCSDTNRIVVYYFDGVYVSTSGNDTNRGTKDSPFRTIQKGIDKATAIGVNNIYISAGTYTPGNGLVNDGTNGVLITNHNIRLIGGWDTGFSNIVGYSELDGNNSLKHIIFATNVSKLVMSNLVVRKGNANGSSPHDSGGGIYLSNVSYSLISNVVVSNNSANNGGGGLYLESSGNNTISGVVSSNSANVGGGLYIVSSGNNTISGVVSGNSANWYGGGVCLDSSTNNTISENVSSNSANWYGGGMYLWYSSNNTISGVVSGNSAQYGGGVFLDSSPNNTISGSVNNNSATNYGGGMYLESSGNNTISGVVSGNSAQYGGGVYLSFSSNNIIYNVSQNYATLVGGGLYLTNSTIILSGNIKSNISGMIGGGIALQNSAMFISTTSVEISYNKISNSTNFGFGGGIYIEGCTNLSLSNLSVIQNSITSGSNSAGAGILITKSENITIYDTETSYNSITSPSNISVIGGGICVSYSKDIVIENSTIQKNSITSGGSIFGGGLGIAYSTSVTLINNYNLSYNIISNLSSTGTNIGGGTSIIFSSNITLYNTSVNYNTNSGGNFRVGGGMSISDSREITLSNMIGSQNNIILSGGKGGGISISKVENLNLYDGFISQNSPGGISIVSSINTVITNSQVKWNEGVGIEISLSTNTGVVNSTIAFNINNLTGGGILIISNSNIFISNNIISSNQSYQLGGGIAIIENSTSDSPNIKITYNTISFNYSQSNQGGGGIYARNTRSLTIQSNILSNNISSGESTTITLHSLSGANSWNNLIITLNTFYGSGSSPVAIWEEGTNAGSDIKQHTIQSNTFYLSSYSNLYRDPDALLGPGYITNNLLGITNLNTANSPYHDAINVGGNSGGI